MKLIEKATLTEILGILNAGLMNVENYSNIRIINNLKPDYVIISVESEIGEDIMKFMESEGIRDVPFESTVTDYVVINKTDMTNMSLTELGIAVKEMDVDPDWDFNKPNFTCYEINRTEALLVGGDLNTDMQ